MALGQNERAREAYRRALELVDDDNLDVDQVRQCAGIVAGRVALEVSGNITLDNVRAYAETGVQFVSVGALTHSVRALDLSLQVL